MRKWAKGLLAAMVNGAAVMLGGVIGAFVFTDYIPWKILGLASAFGAISGGVSYIMKSPFPQDW